MLTVALPRLRVEIGRVRSRLAFFLILTTGKLFLGASACGRAFGDVYGRSCMLAIGVVAVSSILSAIAGSRARLRWARPRWRRQCHGGSTCPGPSPSADSQKGDGRAS
ncbi:MAG: hypothetical protein U0575_13840 [Phycisphaerales bacterium]